MSSDSRAWKASPGVVRARLETFDGIEQAIRFCRKHGWSETGRAPDVEYGFTRVFFEKHLGKDEKGKDVD